MEGFINCDLLSEFAADDFRARDPFPWANLHGFLTPGGFAALLRDFPPIDAFEEHRDINRAYGQRPHNRYYLAYQTSIYHFGENPQKGVVRHDQLPATWQRFLEELNTSEPYKEFVRATLGVPDFKTRYAWHLGFNGSEVSPHVDSPDKLGTHILYFNTSEDWDPKWGGETLALGGKRKNGLNPDFDDFSTSTPVQILDNDSFFFKNTPHSWHGVRPLTSPPGKFRRLFNVIFDSPGAADDRGISLTDKQHRPGLIDRTRTFLRIFDR